ncbi:hypothetical protein CDV36_009477 [Fusarium kuroshium]|uniref:Uncharacterized protein n=1 Tax=Fusarium kuroshium TaxID=2010991 RepID=A0A3M2S000_9HYPO|nr:hypothetical protein CDV36_009477 [Fusarium kuroshium]
MSLFLADEWLELEATLGYRPRMSGRTVIDIRNAVNLMTKNRPGSAQESQTLNIYDTTINGPHEIKVRVYEPRESTEKLGQDVALL